MGKANLARTVPKHVASNDSITLFAVQRRACGSCENIVGELGVITIAKIHDLRTRAEKRSAIIARFKVNLRAHDVCNQLAGHNPIEFNSIR